MSTPTLSILDCAAQFDASSAHAEEQWCKAHPLDKEWHHGRYEAFRDAATFLREHGVLRWTRDLPTIEGVYWYRDPHCSSRMWKPISVTVWRDGDALYASAGWVTDNPMTVAQFAWQDSIWAGPLPSAPPEPPSAGGEESTP